MKADGGALVYVIIAVISLIVSAVTKSKKKELQQQNTPKPTSSEPSSPQQPQQTTWQKELEDIFGKVLTEPEVVVKKAEYIEPKPVVRDEVKPQKQSHIDERKKYSTDSSNIKLSGQPNIEAKTVILAEEEEPALASSSLDEFELNKAVIYSEIINRKYF